MEIIKCNSLEDVFNQVANAISKKMDETKMTQETKPVPHVHQDKIVEWAADPSAVWQFDNGLGSGWETIIDNRAPDWRLGTKYRRKPRWYDMEQEWLAKGKPPVEFRHGAPCIWVEQIPLWHDTIEYRFKEVSRHAALKAEWEAKGRPKMMIKNILGEWALLDSHPDWVEEYEYKFSPTPHPDADILRALADDSSLSVLINVDQYGWGMFDISKARLRIKP